MQSLGFAEEEQLGGDPRRLAGTASLRGQVETAWLPIMRLQFSVAARPGWNTGTAVNGHGTVIIRNASLVLTMDPRLGDLENADVLIAGDRIRSVGRSLGVADAKLIDGRGKIVMPGFVDAHTHLWQTLIRGRASDQNLHGWLNKCVTPLYGSAVTGADAYAGARLSAFDSVSSGITTVVDWSHAYNADFACGNLRALTDSKLRFFFAYGCEGSLEQMSAVRRLKHDLIDRSPLAHLQIAVHATVANYTRLAPCVQLGRELGVPLNVHLNESQADLPTEQMEALRRLRALRPGLIVNHAVYMTDAELDELARHDVRVSHSPLSNMRLAAGVARLPDMRARGIKIGLGLDGGPNDTTDMFNTMRIAVGLQRAVSTNPTTFPMPGEALRMATLGGAEVLGLEREIGSLTPGKQADIQVIDAQQVNFAPRVDWKSQLVFNAQPSNVHWVFVNGIALKRNGHLAGNVRKALRDAQAAADRVNELLCRAR